MVPPMAAAEPAGLATSYLALRDVHHTRHEDVAQRDAHRETAATIAAPPPVEDVKTPRE